MDYLRDAWYVAAWEDEIPRDTLFHRTILSEPVLLYRTPADEIVALADRCPHRFAPLHLGRLVGDVVQCGYHGLCFGPSGECVSSPHGDGKIPRGARVKRYVTVRKHKAVWIWPGDSGRADPAMIPDYSFLTQPNPNAVFTGYLPTACNYQLATDNIMDLSHADYLHVGSLDTQGAIARTKAKVWEQGLSVHCDWWLANSRAIGVFRPDLAEPDGPVDQWFEVCWDPPALMLLRAGVTAAGRPRKEGVDVAAVHTERSIVFYVRDPGAGFRWETIEHAATANPPDNPSKHLEVREQKGMRPGGFGILMAQRIVDELIYSEIGNEVLLIKHTA